MKQTHTGIPYVYPTRNGQAWRVIVWNAHFQELLDLGVHQSLQAAQDRAQQALRILGHGYYQRTRKRTNCQRGHPLLGKNVSIRLGPNGEAWRDCLACRRERDARYRAAKRAKKEKTSV